MLSLLNGAHMVAFPKVATLLREKGGRDILVFGGGIIPEDDKPSLEKEGIHGNWGPGTPLDIIVNTVYERVKERRQETNRGKKSR
jgi:methylmalonyl-CoA mutase C-terminal domain/subunit